MASHSLVEVCTPSMRADRLLAENILGLLRQRGHKQHDLAQWCRHSDVWLSNILSSKREVQFRDLDRIADFFGLATYQLLQPGVSERTERRAMADRRQRKDRRISHATRLARELEERVRPTKGGRHGEVAATGPIDDLFIDLRRRFTRLLAEAESRGQVAISRRPQPAPPARPRETRGSDSQESK